MRDAISKIKYGGAPELGLQSGSIRRAIAFGISQSGRFLREFVYRGWNDNAHGRRVFDGVWPHVTGAGRLDIRNTTLRDLIAAGKAEPSFIVSHELPLDRAPEAYEHFDKRDDGWTKVVLKPKLETANA